MILRMDHYENVTPDDLPPLPMPTEQEAAEMALEFDELRIEEFRIDDEPDHDDADDVAQYADEQSDEDYSDDDGMTDAEADADTLRMAGMGTDEDYGGMIGGDSDLLGEF